MRTRRAPQLILIIGLAMGACGAPDVLPPELVIDECTEPAPLLGTPPATVIGYIVAYKPGVNAVTETARLEARYGFTAKFVYTVALSGFAVGPLPPAALAGVRCAPSVSFVEYDQLVTTG